MSSFNAEIDKNLNYVHLNSFNCQLSDFSIKTKLSFIKVIDYWIEVSKYKNNSLSNIAKIILKEIEKYPELQNPMDDYSIVEKHKDVVELMMSAVYPYAQINDIIAFSTKPFDFNHFMGSPQFLEEMEFHKDQHPMFQTITSDQFNFKRTLGACMLIMKQIYNRVIVDNDFAMIINIPRQNGLDRYFKYNINSNFCKVIAKNEVKQLSDKDFEELFNNFTDVEVWKKHIDFDNFEIHGFMHFNVIDVTDEQTTSSLKNLLIDKQSIISQENFKEIEHKIKSLMGIDDIKLGLSALPQDSKLYNDYATQIGDSFLIFDFNGSLCSQFKDSLYFQLIKNKESILIDDFEKIEYKTPLEERLISRGIRNLFITPLIIDDQIKGVLEIASPIPNMINQVNKTKILMVQSLFATSVARTLDEIESQIQTIIKEECTAIHPTVEWRFRKEAIKLMAQRNAEIHHSEMGDIIFDNVYPLYGQSDIKNSSEIRNNAIQKDLITQINLLKDIFVYSQKINNMHIVGEILFRIDNYLDKISLQLNSGDEAEILDVIRFEIEPILNHLKTLDISLKNKIDDYYSKIDKQINCYSEKRKDFDTSVQKLNTAISNYIEEEQIAAQMVFPHYFEKYKTDGVEHGIYIGSSLVDSLEFNPIYLRNLKLWQLMVLAGSARIANLLKSEIAIPLELTHLILVQDHPLSIRFRMDEKKFDADGTYNIRYEILKKRIDKAYIKDTNERLTQPGMIAIVYTQVKESVEYSKFINFLASKNILENQIEYLELEDLQGVTGLKALRVKVKNNMPLENTIHTIDFSKSELLLEGYLN